MAFEKRHNSGTYIGKSGTEIFFQSWNVNSPRGILIISPGISDHSGRYSHIIEKLKNDKISIFALDHRGNGKSGGKKGHVDSFSDYIYDLKIFIDFIKQEHENKPFILLGHSMGGLIALKYAIEYPDDLQGLLLSAPAIRKKEQISTAKDSFARFIARYLPRMTFKTEIFAEDLSQDSRIIDAYENDPYVYYSVTAKWYSEIKKTIDECLDRLSEVKLPLILLHGSDDKITDPIGSELLFDSIASNNKELHIFEGLFHETHNEIEKKRKVVLKIIKDWIMKNIRESQQTTKKKSTKKGTSKGTKKTTKSVKKSRKKA